MKTQLAAQRLPHPISAVSQGSWQSPWRGFVLAVRLPNSFGLAMTMGAMVLLCLILLGLIGFSIGAVFSNIKWVAYPLSEILGWLRGLALPFAIYFFLTLFLASRFINPEIRIWEGFKNLKLGPALGFAALMASCFSLFASGLGWSIAAWAFNVIGWPGSPFGPPEVWLFTLPLGLVAAFVFQLLASLALRFSLREDARVPLTSLFRSSKFLINQALLSFALWATWGLMTAASVAMTAWIVSSGAWLLLFVIIPFCIILVSGYTMLLFAAVFVAPYKVAGWTLTEAENLSNVFD